MNPRKRERERAKARTFWRRLSNAERSQIGDDLVLGTFEWSEWLGAKPTGTFLRAVDEERIGWEIMA